MRDLMSALSDIATEARLLSRLTNKKQSDDFVILACCESRLLERQEPLV